MPANCDFQRLHRRKDIMRVFRRGARLRGRAFDLIRLRGEERGPRIAVVVPLLGRRAVDRNRVKRRMKEALRTGGFLGGAWGDYVVRANPGAYDMRYDEIARELRRAFADTDRREGRTRENHG